MENLFSFQGKIGRLQFFTQSLILQLLALGLFFGIMKLGDYVQIVEPLSTIVYETRNEMLPFILILASLPAVVKRLRDLEFPVFLSLGIFLPVIKLIMILIFYFYKGKKHNQQNA